MQAVIAVVIGLMVSAPVVAEPLIEGWVRRSSGQPVEAAQVMVFDWTDLRRGAVAQATTDATGYFALPLASLGGSVLPQAWTLGQNYPNPFNPSTIIPYQLPTATHVRLEVFNLLGQRIATLVDREQPAGFHTAQWHATDGASRAVAAGVYIYRMTVGAASQTGRMVLIDGQAGQAAASVPRSREPSSAPAAEGVYGLTVTGAGLVTYVDASFGVRSGMAPVEVVVEAGEGLPRGKALTDRVLGDVNGDGQVDLADALLLVTYVADPSLLALTDRVLGDVNGDGEVNLADALLLVTYVANPADPSLPAGIGQAVSSDGELEGGLDGPLVAGAIRRLTNHEASDLWPVWSPDGRHIAFESRRDGIFDIYVMEADGSNPRRLTNHEADDRYPDWSPDGRHIAFWSERDGNREIYVMEADGSNPRRLTNHEADDRFPAWSPDGRHIAFQSWRDGNREIYVMEADGSNPRRLTDHEADDWFPVWSPDGRHIAFSSNRDRYYQIYVMEVNTPSAGPVAGAIRRLTRDSATDVLPSWSPDGQQIAFMSDRGWSMDIYVMEADGSNPRNLTGLPRNDTNLTGEWWADDTDPVWSPDGQQIAFVSVRDLKSLEIYVMEADGSNPRNLTLHQADDISPSWSPDGRHIAFVSDRGWSQSIYVMDADGNNQRRLTDDEGDDWEPAWSPDGRQIAFWSERDDNTDIYVMDADGSNQRRLTTDGGVSPSWSPDGQHIAFASWGAIYVMDAYGGNIRNLTTDGGVSPSWSPDGRHIAFVSRRDGNPEIYVMELREE